MPAAFNAWKSYIAHRIETRKIKADLTTYAQQVYQKNLQRKVLAGIREQAEEAGEHARKSRLFPIF